MQEWKKIHKMDMIRKTTRHEWLLLYGANEMVGSVTSNMEWLIEDLITAQV